MTKSQVIKQQVVYLPTRNLERAQQFYAYIFEFEPSSLSYAEDPSGEKWSLFPLTKINEQGETIATGFYFIGLAESPKLVPSDQGTTAFLPCDDIEQTLQKVEEAGGTILQGKTKDPLSEQDSTHKVEVYHAFFLDTEGNRVGLLSGKMKPQTTQGPQDN